MRVVVLLVAGLLATACTGPQDGGRASRSTSPPAAGAAAAGASAGGIAPTPTPATPYPGSTAKQLYAKVRQALAAAETVHVTSTAAANGHRVDCDLRLAGDHRATGACRYDGHRLDIRRLGDVLYLRGSAAAWRRLVLQLTRTAAGRLASHWVRFRRGPDAAEPLFGMVDYANLLPKGHRTAARGTQVDRAADLDGRTAVALVEDDAREDALVLYVSPTEPALPVALEAQYGRTRADYAGWGEPFTVQRPRRDLLRAN